MDRVIHYLWLPTVVIGCYGVGRIWKETPGPCFAFPLLAGITLTVWASRRRLASAWIGLAGLTVMVWVSSWPPMERRDDQALQPLMKFGLQCVLLWVFLFVGLMMPLKSRKPTGKLTAR